MPNITPYDPTQIKNLVVGTANYGKAKAGEAAAAMAEGLGQIRNQVHSNAMQRIADQGAIGQQLIGGLAQVAHKVGRAVAVQNALLANHAATTSYYDAMKAMDAAQDGMTQAYSDPSQTPKLADDTNTLLTQNAGPPGSPALVNQNGQAADYNSIMQREKDNPLYKHNPAALAHLDNMLQANIYSRVRTADHVARNMMTTQADMFGDAVVAETEAGANAISADPNEAIGQYNKQVLNAQHAISQNQSVAGAGLTAKLSRDLAVRAPTAYVNAMVNKQLGLIDKQGKPDPLQGGVHLDMLQAQVHSSAFSHMDPKAIASFDQNIESARQHLTKLYKVQDTSEQQPFHLWATDTVSRMSTLENKDDKNYQNNVIQSVADHNAAAETHIKEYLDDPSLPQAFRDIAIETQRKSIDKATQISEKAQANIRHVESGEAADKRAAKAEAGAQFRADTAEFNQQAREAKADKAFKLKVSQDQAQSNVNQLGFEMSNMNLATQQQELIKKAEELTDYIGKEHLAGHLTADQAGIAQRRASAIIEASQHYVPDRSWFGFGPPTGTYTYQSSVTGNKMDKSTDDKVRARQAGALAKVSQLQQGWQLATKYSAQAKLAGLDEKQMDQYDLAAESIISNWQSGKLQAWDRDKKLNGLMAQVVKSVPKESVKAKPKRGDYFTPPPPAYAPSMGAGFEAMTPAQLRQMADELEKAQKQ